MARIRARFLTLLLAVSLTAGALPGSAFGWSANAPKLALDAQRVAGANRFAAAAAMAASAYPGWEGISHVVIASGDERAVADPLAASGLCWAYDAPLLLTSAGSTPAETKAALAAIVSENTTVTVHVVGGTRSVPSARLKELRAIVGAAGAVEQPWPTGSRYALAAQISKRVSNVAAAESRARPNSVFVANGAEPKRFSDALAASAISRHTGVPVLLTAADTVPAETSRALAALGDPDTIVIGGTQAVTARAFTALKADRRWHGANRYATAAEVSRLAVARGWVDGAHVGVAAKIPDALAGAAAVGRSGGVVLMTDPERLPKETWARLRAAGTSVTACSVLGGKRSVSDSVLGELRGAPGRPMLGSGQPGDYVGKSMRVAGRANSNTTSVTLYVAGTRIGSRTVGPYGAFDFGTVASPAKSASVEVRATNPDGGSASVWRTVKRLVYPYATCIIVDKSEFRLYWVKDNELVKTYPIAHGRVGASTPSRTWKILSKYHSDPGSVYGPRKMRLYVSSGGGWNRTSYLIHGTSNPASIGTRASAGCVRMYNRDVLELFPQVPIGTMVITRD